jgi:hypothetical protein
MEPTFERDGRKGWYRSKFDTHPADLGGWLIQHPGAHPFWQFWCVTCVTLKDVEGMPPAKKHFPEATHEILFLAINPDYPPDPEEFLQGAPMHWLSPTDLVYQTELPSDDLAIELMELAAKDIVLRGTSPDQDYRSHWKKTLDLTCDHLRGGHGAKA